MRWIGIALAIAAVAFALAKIEWRAPRERRADAARESIDDASHEKLERVLRDAGAGEAAKP